MCPERISDSISEISRWQRAIHAAIPKRSAFICSNVRPSPSSVAFSARQPLPPLDNDVNVLRIELQSAADALGQFSRGERGAAAKKWLVDQVAKLGVIQDRATHQRDGFLRGVIEFLLIRAAHDELR